MVKVGPIEVSVVPHKGDFAEHSEIIRHPCALYDATVRPVPTYETPITNTTYKRNDARKLERYIEVDHEAHYHIDLMLNNGFDFEDADSVIFDIWVDGERLDGVLAHKADYEDNEDPGINSWTDCYEGPRRGSDDNLVLHWIRCKSSLTCPVSMLTQRVVNKSSSQSQEKGKPRTGTIKVEVRRFKTQGTSQRPKTVPKPGVPGKKAKLSMQYDQQRVPDSAGRHYDGTYVGKRLASFIFKYGTKETLQQLGVVQISSVDTRRVSTDPLALGPSNTQRYPRSRTESDRIVSPTITQGVDALAAENNEETESTSPAYQLRLRKARAGKRRATTRDPPSPTPLLSPAVDVEVEDDISAVAGILDDDFQEIENSVDNSNLSQEGLRIQPGAAPYSEAPIGREQDNGETQPITSDRPLSNTTRKRQAQSVSVDEDRKVRFKREDDQEDRAKKPRFDDEKLLDLKKQLILRKIRSLKNDLHPAPVDDAFLAGERTLRLNVLEKIRREYKAFMQDCDDDEDDEDDEDRELRKGRQDYISKQLVELSDEIIGGETELWKTESGERNVRRLKREFTSLVADLGGSANGTGFEVIALSDDD